MVLWTGTVSAEDHIPSGGEAIIEKVILIHGSGHKASSWQKTISYLDHQEDILCPELSAILNGREASFPNLRAAFAQYCAQSGGPVHLCGLSLGGILALDYALDHPENIKTLVLIGTPHKVPKGAFALQNVVFRFLPKSTFASMAFNKRDTFALGNSMKDLDFSGRLGELRCPTLILCGEKDGANLQSARFLAEHIPGAELRVIENTGHVVNEENPRALAERLNEFYTLHA